MKLVGVGIDQATSAGDADTADLFTEITRETDELRRLVAAHRQAQR